MKDTGLQVEKEMMPSSFHRNWGAGIDGNAKEGTAAIVLSGGYETTRTQVTRLSTRALVETTLVASDRWKTRLGITRAMQDC